MVWTVKIFTFTFTLLNTGVTQWGAYILCSTLAHNFHDTISSRWHMICYLLLNFTRFGLSKQLILLEATVILSPLW